MDNIIDQAWASLLASAMKKRDVLRPEIGDEIDLYIPQSRLLSLTQSNTEGPRILYNAAHSSAERNARTIVKKLGMPADYFWKFEYWPKARALTNLDQIVKKVFSSMMARAKQGNLEIMGLEVDPLRISIGFNGCVECAGISGFGHGICYYHAGTFSGILSGLINRSLDSFETDCHAAGHAACLFSVGDKEDQEIKTKHDAYMLPTETKTDLVERLEKSFSSQPVRAIGNRVDVNYYRLIMANTLLANPEQSASYNFEVGSKLGRKLASVLTKFYHHEGLQNMRDYYSQFGEFYAEVKGDEVQVKFVITECAELIGPIKSIEMISFLFGELQGLTSELTKREVVLKEHHFDGEKLLITFIQRREV